MTNSSQNSSTHYIDIKAKLESLGLSPKKSLGQNFLVSPGVIQKILLAVQKKDPQFLIEIGPGLGSLTDELLKLQRPLCLMELDREFAQYWREQKQEIIQEVIEGDALRWDWNLLKQADQTVLVSNLPYQISSSLVIDRSMQSGSTQQSEKNDSVQQSRKNLGLKGMVLMFQKEVAERITASPKTEAYGLLSVIAQNFWTTEVVAEAGPRDFYPPPRVASRVLAFTPRHDFEGVPREFLKVVKAGFAQRRKYLISNLKALGGKATDSNLRAIFDRLDWSHQIRAEELHWKQWRELVHHLHRTD